MKYKYGNMVIIKKKDSFYDGVIGKLVAYDRIEGSYEVQLDQGLLTYMYEHELKLSKKGAKDVGRSIKSKT